MDFTQAEISKKEYDSDNVNKRGKQIKFKRGNMVPNKKQERYLIFDESGNLGSLGRYFTIACIDVSSPKALHNIMHKKLNVAKTKFPELSALHANEIKAKDAYPCIKYHILECIARKDLSY